MRISHPKATGQRLRKHAATATLLVVLISVSAMIQRIRSRTTRNSVLRIDGSENLYKLPMCDESGRCHEAPSIPSPRTEYSSKSLEQHNLWFRAHAELNRSAEAYASRRSAAGGGNIDDSKPLILLGDSITEAWLGTDMGLSVGRTSGVPEVLRSITAKNHLDPLVLAIGGDQTQHLLWRLEHGELLSAFADDPDSIFVLLIGTNNLGSGILPQPTVKGVVAVARLLLSKTRGRLILISLLPRGDVQRLGRLCPPRCDSGGGPFASFMPAVEEVNEGVRAATVDFGKEFNGRFNLIDCGEEFLSHEGSSEVKENLMPDRLHPNAEGQMIFAHCLISCINGTTC